MSERKPNGDISYIDLRFTFCKAKPQDASLFLSPINPAIWFLCLMNYLQQQGTQ